MKAIQAVRTKKNSPRAEFMVSGKDGDNEGGKDVKS
jgi:hypothetical protein